MTAKVSKVRKLGIEGFIPATYTPLDANGDLNLSIIPFYAAHLSKHKAIKAVFVNGTTGESVSLSLKERKLIVEGWVKVAPKYNLKVIAMVGTNSFKTVKPWQCMLQISALTQSVVWRLHFSSQPPWIH
eukprot:905980_1